MSGAVESPVGLGHYQAVLKILVIEDHAPMRRNLVKLLQRESFEVVAAENGRFGLDPASAEKPDLALCDIILGGPGKIQC